jgi:hypothetical protein
MSSKEPSKDDLDPMTNETERTVDVTASERALDVEVEDPWVLDESTTISLPESSKEDRSTEEALSKLKDSSQRLVSNLDQKLGLSQALGILGTSVKNLDDKVHVTSTVQTAGTTIGQWISGMDQQYGILQTSKGIGSKIMAIVPTQEISEGINSTFRGFQAFDESHGITKSTAETLAGGAEFLNSAIERGEQEDQTNAVDEDGIPTSFKK